MEQTQVERRMEFARRMKKYMDLQNLKVADLVRMSQQTGKAIHRDTFYKILRADTGVSLEIAQRIASFLNVNLSVLAD